MYNIYKTKSFFLKKAKSYRKIFFFLLFFFININVFAGKLAILPARILGVHSSQVKTGPHLFPKKSINSWEVAKFFSLYLKITGKKDIIPPSYVKGAYTKARLKPNKKITKNNLNQLGILLDTDQLMSIFIVKTKQGFRLESKIYYTASQTITDRLITKHTNFWQLISKHLQLRFPYNKLPISLQSRSTRPILFLFVASGSNYNEIKKLKQLIEKIDTLYSAACAINGRQNLSSSNIGRHPQIIKKFFNKLSTRGGSLYLKGFEKAIQCIQKKNPYQGNLNDKPYVISIVSSMPETDNERLLIKSKFRDLASKSDILILGSGNLSNEARNFWQNLSRELRSVSKSEYKDIIYQQKVGLSSGEEWYLYKRGFSLIESQSKILSKNQTGIELAIHLRKKFTSRRIKYIYKQISKNKVISSSRVKILLKDLILDFLGGGIYQNNKKEKILRVLIKVNQKPFWINIPKSSAYTRNGQLKLIRNKKYYFLLQLLSAKKGMPFSNSKNFALFFKTRRNIPRGMILNINKYLMNPQRYLNKSIAGTSLYFILGRVEIIRFSQNDIFEK